MLASFCVFAHDPQPSIVITQNMIATGKLFTTNMVGPRFLEPDQEGKLYLEFNVGRTVFASRLNQE
jgi:hypothetical protein